ncbi:unnamed protein product [Dibothriocephalus latus]|uniref:Protein kinase domain-containing protein n=1 Tax=Dibothriocephalus latus TaxID=60516 RepID=A0A3P7MQM2_DIBLA|nr:unnamed protein product [Dibothriocephalus latus]
MLDVVFYFLICYSFQRIETSLTWSRERNFDKDWIRLTADQMLASLSEVRIANDVFQQLLVRLHESHELFSQTLRRLEARAEQRTTQFEESQASIRRYHAPRLARQLLEITSLQNLIVMGYPALGREIGRGQFGVVYTCPTWGSLKNLAVKSVVPADEKHWRELAMEIYYIGEMTPVRAEGFLQEMEEEWFSENAKSSFQWRLVAALRLYRCVGYLPPL